MTMRSRLSKFLGLIHQKNIFHLGSFATKETPAYDMTMRSRLSKFLGLIHQKNIFHLGSFATKET